MEVASSSEELHGCSIFIPRSMNTVVLFIVPKTSLISCYMYYNLYYINKQELTIAVHKNLYDDGSFGIICTLWTSRRKILKDTVFWDVTACKFVDSYWSFRGICSLRLQIRKLHDITSQKNSNLHRNLKAHVIIFLCCHSWIEYLTNVFFQIRNSPFLF
jgi:hypothetical protein